jgi:2'-5' RNA ligase
MPRPPGLRAAEATLAAKHADVTTSPSSFFVHARLPPHITARLKAIQQQVLPDPSTRADIDHVSLVYTKQPAGAHAPEKVERAVKALRDVGADARPIDAKIQGWGYFDNTGSASKPRTALVALVDAPGLEHLHVDMARALKAQGIEPSTRHAFTPHITLGYLGEQGRVRGVLPPLNAEFKIHTTHVAARDHHAVPLGVKAAAFAMEKVAIGQRQRQRILDALDKGVPAHADSTQSDTWTRATAAVKNGRPGETASQLDALFSPRGSPPKTLQEIANTSYSPRMWDRAEAEGFKSPHARDVTIFRRGVDHRDMAQVDRMMASGRHTVDDVVDLPRLTQGMEYTTAGAHPETIAWRGAPTHIPATAMVDGKNGMGPRWFSGIPQVAGNYAASRLDSVLRAYDTSQIPAPHIGPWTREVSIDPRGVPPHLLSSGPRFPRNSPIFERVIDAPHIPAPLATYKPLSTPGRFMRVRGPNLLRGVKP